MSVLHPHHLGEAMVARLLAVADWSRVPCHSLAGTTRTLAEHLGASSAREVVPHADLDPTDPPIAGMSALDCALVLEDRVVAVELKLGGTRLTPAHAGELGGGRVALLDWNGRQPPPGQPPVALSAGGRPVARDWLLMLRESVWESWRGAPELAEALGTSQLAGVLTLEELGRVVGNSRAREIALALARESIDAWFPPAPPPDREATRRYVARLDARRRTLALEVEDDVADVRDKSFAQKGRDLVDACRLGSAILAARPDRDAELGRQEPRPADFPALWSKLQVRRQRP